MLRKTLTALLLSLALCSLLNAETTPTPMTLKVGTTFADGFKRPVKNIHIKSSDSTIASADWNGQYIAVKALKIGDAVISITGDYDDQPALDAAPADRSFSQTYNLTVTSSLTGDWTAKGYEFEDKPPTTLHIEDSDNTFTATKITGNKYVPAGKISFYGTRDKDTSALKLKAVDADENYQNPVWTDVTIAILNNDRFSLIWPNHFAVNFARVVPPKTTTQPESKPKSPSKPKAIPHDDAPVADKSAKSKSPSSQPADDSSSDDNSQKKSKPPGGGSSGGKNNPSNSNSTKPSDASTKPANSTSKPAPIAPTPLPTTVPAPAPTTAPTPAPTTAASTPPTTTQPTNVPHITLLVRPANQPLLQQSADSILRSQPFQILAWVDLDDVSRFSTTGLPVTLTNLRTNAATTLKLYPQSPTAEGDTLFQTQSLTVDPAANTNPKAELLAPNNLASLNIQSGDSITLSAGTDRELLTIYDSPASQSQGRITSSLKELQLLYSVLNQYAPSDANLTPNLDNIAAKQNQIDNALTTLFSPAFLALSPADQLSQSTSTLLSLLNATGDIAYIQVHTQSFGPDAPSTIFIQATSSLGETTTITRAALAPIDTSTLSIPSEPALYLSTQLSLTRTPYPSQ